MARVVVDVARQEGTLDCVVLAMYCVCAFVYFDGDCRNSVCWVVEVLGELPVLDVVDYLVVVQVGWCCLSVVGDLQGHD